MIVRCKALCFASLLLPAMWSSIGGMSFAQVDPSETDPNRLFEPRQFSGESEGTAGELLNYRLLKPLDYDPAEHYPLIVFLHGAGERGADNTSQLKHGMKVLCSAEIRQEFPCYVLAPQCPTDQRWAEVDWSIREVEMPEKTSVPLALTFELIDQMIEHAAIDPSRIYLTGLSMGGYGTWDAISRRPHFFAAAVPICGGGDPRVAETLTKTPIWCFHGAADKVVVVGKSRDMVDAIKKHGGEPKYTEYPGVGHNSWTATYKNDELYQWLFSQRRTKRAQQPTEK